ncbi:hypothetical protein FE394_09355 [Xenorhabdus sp. Reich]|uniref:Tetracyclin repressor-like C-terminal domain-containing protein n=1 Tax=Xenorhabdus littoralis TaxID=2582835 RepID=A0ABU4SL74_9GAMM|nr:TetR-like C-terminal domain-containing protein [Xenorhabdus sp. Reich]MDX7999403.1 hypothetical protein [Xenorhabdus sp. Reich]
MALLREDFMQRRFALPREIFLSGIRSGELPQNTDVDLILVTLFGFCWFHLLTDNLGDTSILEPFIHYIFKNVPLKPVG